MVTPAKREADFDAPPSAPSVGPAPTEILAVPSQIAARSSSASPIPTVRLDERNLPHEAPPRSPFEASDDGAPPTVALQRPQDAFAGERTESFDPLGVERVASGAGANDASLVPTTRFALPDDQDVTDAGAGRTEPEDVQQQPDWLLKGRPIDLPRPPGGAPSAFSDPEIPIPPEPGPPSLEASTAATGEIATEELPAEAPSRAIAGYVVVAALVAVVVGSAGAYASGALDPGIARLRQLLGADTAVADPSTTDPVEPPPPADPATPTSASAIAVRVDLVNDASGSEFAPLAAPLRDKFLATLLAIKPFVADRPDAAKTRIRFTLFVGATDVKREEDNLMASSSCSLAASVDGTDEPARLMKARAMAEKLAKRVVVPPPPKKKMKKRERLLYEKKLADVAAKEKAAARDVARAAVSRCAYELAQSFAEKQLEKLAPPAPAPAPGSPPPGAPPGPPAPGAGSP